MQPGAIPLAPKSSPEAKVGGLEEVLELAVEAASLKAHRGLWPCVYQDTQTLSPIHQLKAPPDTPSLSQKESSSRKYGQTNAKLNHCWENQVRCTLTKELGGIRVAGLLVVGESFIDDLPDGRIQTLQLFVLGGHTGST